MTLADMADQVTERIGVTDDNTTLQAKKFLRRRYQVVYDSQLWSDAQVAVPYTLYNGADVIHVPAMLETILQIRVGASGSSQLLRQINHQQVFQLNPDALDEVGSRVAWTELSPSATLAPLVGNEFLTLYSTSVNDTGVEVRVRAQRTVAYGSDLVDWTVRVDGTTEVFQSSVGLITAVVNVESISKPVTQGEIRMGNLSSPGAVYARIKASDSHPSYKRVQLLRAAASANASGEALLFYGKHVINPLIHDNDVPQIKNIEEVLIAYTTADMLERERQWGKAQLKVQEGSALLMSRILAERTQKSNSIQIVPDTETYAEEGYVY